MHTTLFLLTLADARTLFFYFDQVFLKHSHDTYTTVEQ